MSEFVWGTRKAESVGRGRERSACRVPLTLMRAVHASRFPAGRSRYRDRTRWPICAGPEGPARKRPSAALARRG
jgi:hypothetical protein